MKEETIKILTDIKAELLRISELTNIYRGTTNSTIAGINQILETQNIFNQEKWLYMAKEIVSEARVQLEYLYDKHPKQIQIGLLKEIHKFIEPDDAYTYEVIAPITDYGFNKAIGDLMTSKQIESLPPFYRTKVKLLNSPDLKK